MDHLFHKNLLAEKHNLEWQLAQANFKIKNLQEQLNKLTKQTMISEEIVNPGTSNPNVPPPPNPFQKNPPFTRPLPDNTRPVPMPRTPGRFNFPSDFIKQIEGLPSEFWDRIRPGRRPRTVQEGYEILSEYVNQNGIEGLEQYLNEEQTAGIARWLRELLRKITGSPKLPPKQPRYYEPSATRRPPYRPSSNPAVRPLGEPLPVKKRDPRQEPERYVFDDDGDFRFIPWRPNPRPGPGQIDRSGRPRTGTPPGGVSSDTPDEYYDFEGIPQ